MTSCLMSSRYPLRVVLRMERASGETLLSVLRRDGSVGVWLSARTDRARRCAWLGVLCVVGGCVEAADGARVSYGVVLSFGIGGGASTACCFLKKPMLYTSRCLKRRSLYTTQFSVTVTQGNVLSDRFCLRMLYKKAPGGLIKTQVPLCPEVGCQTRATSTGCGGGRLTSTKPC